MTDYRRQLTDIQRLLSVLLLFIASTCLVHAGEVAIETNGNGSDILEDTTEDINSRSDEVAASTETMLDVAAAHEGDEIVHRGDRSREIEVSRGGRHDELEGAAPCGEGSLPASASTPS